MPRKPRQYSSTGIYHAILRSVNQHLIFEEDFDYQKFLFILSDCKEKYNVDIYAYCLMDNHIHFLISSPPEVLARFFQSLESRFALWYNNKYSRSGHLFQDRFHSQKIESDNHFLRALLYIHNNPVKAGMCRYSTEYRWSSCQAYYGAKDHVVNTLLACNIAGSENALLHFFAISNSKDQKNDLDDLFKDDHRLPKHFTTDEQALITLKKLFNVSSTSEILNLPKAVRNRYVRILRENGLTVNQIARFMDISTRTIIRLCQNVT